MFGLCVLLFFLVFMSIFIWNCQGAGSPAFLSAFRFLLDKHKPNLVVLLEPRISGSKANSFIRKSRISNSHRVEANGFSGEIWLLWNNDWTIQVLYNDRQLMHTCICDNGVPLMYFTAIYGSPAARQLNPGKPYGTNSHLFILLLMIISS